MSSGIPETGDGSNLQTPQISVEVRKSDIIMTPTSAIGAVITQDLEIRGRLNKSLHKAAGPKMDDYILDHIMSLKVGDVFAVPAYNLLAKHVIFAVIPHWRSDLDIIDQHLLGAVDGIMKKAIEIGAEDIALPLICCGGGGYPKSRGIRLILQAASAAFAPPLKKITFVCERDAEIEMFRKRLQ